jgi:hypothetical protein
MKFKKVILISLAVAILGLAGWGVIRIREERFWPFSTGTTDEAFLGTTFGMSHQEVRRALAHYGAQLLNYEDFRKARPESSMTLLGHLPNPFIPLFVDDERDYTSFFMPSIEMFDSIVEAEFQFQREGLASVEVYFDPISHNKADSVVAAIESKLRSTYQFSRREESHDVPGAYTLQFTSASANPSLWVNLTDREHPIISLSVVHPRTLLARKREIQSREQRALGAHK